MKNNNPLVSIVIPVYNASLYLKEAIDSVIRQTYKNLEIICVDDGSTDDSLQILEQYKGIDSRVHIYQQKNLHAGIARNNGLSHAHGEYIIFLDSDDIFEKNMIAVLVNSMLTHEVDTIVFNYYSFSGKKCFRKKQNINYAGLEKRPIDLQNEIFQVTIGAPWNKFYSMKFVKDCGLQFQGTLNSNDIFFTRLASVYSQKTLFLDKCLVNYRINNKQSLQGNINKSPTSFAEAFIAIFNELKRNNLLATYRYSLEQYAIDLCMTALTKAKTRQDLDQVFDVCTDIFNDLGISKENEYAIKSKYSGITNAIIDDNKSQMISELYFYYKNVSVPISTIEYRIGKNILSRFHVKHY